MVAKIEIPADDSVDLLERILAERVKFKVFYATIKNDLISQYNKYKQAEGCPSLVAPMDLSKYVSSPEEAEKRRISLKGLYTPQRTKLPYKQLEKIRKKNSLTACPICGETGRPRTLDHCLPQAAFPEFAVNVLNLVPACDWCQGEKLIDYKNADGRRSFIHPYFDDVNRPLFSLIFAEPYSTPTISIEVKINLPKKLQVLVASHLEGIGFLDRFSEIFNVNYQAIKRMAIRARTPGNLSLSQSLNEALLIASDKAINSWDAVLYRSVLENPDLIIFLNEEYEAQHP